MIADVAKNRVFFPQAALDQWLGESRIDLSGDELVLKGEGRRYRLVEAVRVLSLVGEGSDVHELIGRAKSVPHLTELGAEVLGDSIILGELVYQVVPGFLATPVGTFADHRASQASVDSGATPAPTPESDEELLAQFLINHLE